MLAGRSPLSPGATFAAMRGWAWKLAGLALAVSLLLPWFYGTDDGQPLTIAGWDTEPGFTLGMLARACGIAVGGLLDRPLVAMVSALPAIAVTVWMLPRGELYSGYDLGPGAVVALVVALIAFATALPRPFRH
jgi:hypothetical protein